MVNGRDMRSRFFSAALVAVLTLGMQCDSSTAQSSVSLSNDVLLRLMLSQPSIDTFSPVSATASFDPPVVRPGEKSIYRVTLNAVESAVPWPADLAAPPQLQLRWGVRAQTLEPGNGVLRPFTTFLYEAKPTATGSFTVPAFTVNVYGAAVLIPAAQLEVQANPPAHEPAAELVLEPEATNLFLGQTVNMRVLLPESPGRIAPGLTQVQINGDGIQPDTQPGRQIIRQSQRNGRVVTTYIYETRLTPIATGQLALTAQAFAFVGPAPVPGGAVGAPPIPGGPSQYVLLVSDPVVINARPVPNQGRLPGFTGAVGSFRVEQPRLSATRVRVGDPVQMSVIVRGDQNVTRLTPPPPPQSDEWQIFPSPIGPTVGLVGGTNFGTTFSYTLIPLTDEARATPAIPFSSFDPQKPGYDDLTIPPVPINVRPNGSVTNSAMFFASADNNAKSPDAPALSDLATTPGRTASLVPMQLHGWFVWLQISPALALAALWRWDRHRRFLEAHPDIVRRRRARRQLHRQKRALKRAATAGDGPGFTRCAVTALRIVSAPHYPAEPGAMVCGDVLRLLGQDEQQGRAGEVVRQFFAVADASAYAASPPPDGKLLALKSDLDALLENLEERL